MDASFDAPMMLPVLVPLSICAMSPAWTAWSSTIPSALSVLLSSILAVFVGTGNAIGALAAAYCAEAVG